jgi:hypothetical protein
MHVGSPCLDNCGRSGQARDKCSIHHCERQTKTHHDLHRGLPHEITQLSLVGLHIACRPVLPLRLSHHEDLRTPQTTNNQQIIEEKEKKTKPQNQEVGEQPKHWSDVHFWQRSLRRPPSSYARLTLQERPSLTYFLSPEVRRRQGRWGSLLVITHHRFFFQWRLSTESNNKNKPSMA